MATWLKWSRSVKSFIFHMPIISVSTVLGAVGLSLSVYGAAKGDFGPERIVNQRGINYYEDMGKEIAYEFNSLLDANPTEMLPEYQRVYAKLGAVKKYRDQLDSADPKDAKVPELRKKYLDSAFEVFYAASAEATPAAAEELAAGRQRLIDRGFMSPMPIEPLAVPEAFPLPSPPTPAAAASRTDVTDYFARKWLHRESTWTGENDWVKALDAKLSSSK